jgi:DNA-binding FadR family transcriptional regulator
MYAAEHDEDDLLEAEIGFHVAVLHASNNRFFTQMRELIATAIRFRMRRNKGARHAGARDHAGVAKLILAGGAAGASDAMRRLIQRTHDLMQTGLGKEAAASSKREERLKSREEQRVRKRRHLQKR